MMEEALSMLPMPVTFLRPGWFLENASWIGQIKASPTRHARLADYHLNVVKLPDLLLKT
jgi:hypothetical protein